MGRSKHYDEFSDLDRQMNGDFFSEAEGITSVEDVPASQLELSDEEKSAQLVDVRFDSDGFAHPEETTHEPLDAEVEPAETSRTEEEPLEPMPLPRKVGATEWGSAFAEIHARAFDLANYSKVTATRYIQSGSDKKISCLPSVVDFLADVQIVARKVLSPSLYRVWQEIYWQGFGENAHRVPEAVQLAIQLRCGTAFKKAGLLSFHIYWNVRTKPEKLCAVSLEIVPDARETRNKRRRADRKARPVISTYKAAA